MEHKCVYCQKTEKESDQNVDTVVVGINRTKKSPAQYAHYACYHLDKLKRIAEKEKLA